ncbi:MAG: VOC family protein [Patescibacteria group bacterium]
MQKITPFLWFDTEATAAADFYVSVFGGDSKLLSTQVMTDTPSGTVEIVNVSLRGQEFTLMSAGPLFKFTEAISFVIDCENQEEVDHFWNALSAVPTSEQCGWLKDKYGVSWQVVPRRLNELLADPDKAKAGRVTQTMLQMKKIVIADLEKAAQG